MSLISEENMLLLPIIVFCSLAVLLLVAIVYYDSVRYDQLKSEIPNMDCRKLVQIHMKYDYWLNGEKDTTLFQRESLFDLWYDRILELGCVNP